ncbi:MAG: hypothetical protein MUO77_08980 [Anaerolineales bacterium]|nr:hypothetical protein [Anaerolineales bacterium]
MVLTTNAAHAACSPYASLRRLGPPFGRAARFAQAFRVRVASGLYYSQAESTPALATTHRVLRERKPLARFRNR